MVRQETSIVSPWLWAEKISFIFFSHSPIVGLLFARGPLNIARNIIAIIINSINRVVQAWPFSNMCNKIRERLIPWFMEFNSSSSVPMIPGGAGVVTSAFHAHPATIRRGSTSTIFGCSMCFHSTCPAFGGFSSHKVPGGYKRGVSARTLTLPFHLFTLSNMFLGNVEFAKKPSDQVESVAGSHIAPVWRSKYNLPRRIT